MKVFGFYLLYSIIWLFTLLPFRLLYLFSDIIYFVVFDIVRYRRDIIFNNLKFAFPEKTDPELRKIAVLFQHHFCDTFIESLKTMHMSQNDLFERFKYKNPEIFDTYYKRDQSVVLISGHYGNWEWLVNFQLIMKHRVLAIYKPLRSSQFDKLIKKLRKKFAGRADMIAMNDVLKVIIDQNRRNEKIITWFLGDQTPPKDYPLWISFMNRETPFYSGPEKIARKFNHAVVFMNIDKVKRGYYEVEFIPLFDEPAKTKELEITRKHVETLEYFIRKKPELWLWSHRRWKHQKENIQETEKSPF